MTKVEVLTAIATFCRVMCAFSFGAKVALLVVLVLDGLKPEMQGHANKAQSALTWVVAFWAIMSVFAAYLAHTA
jgi:hypothetical protein